MSLIALGAVMAIALGCLLLGCKGYNDESTQSAKKKISEENFYSELDRLCTSLPISKDAELLGMRGLWNTKTIGYYYRTNMDRKEISEDLRKFFQEKDWNLSSEQPFPSGNAYEEQSFRVAI